MQAGKVEVGEIHLLLEILRQYTYEEEEGGILEMGSYVAALGWIGTPYSFMGTVERYQTMEWKNTTTTTGLRHDEVKTRHDGMTQRKMGYGSAI